MKMIILIISSVTSLIITFCLWCCIRVGSLSDREIENMDKVERVRQEERGEP